MYANLPLPPPRKPSPSSRRGRDFLTGFLLFLSTSHLGSRLGDLLNAARVLSPTAPSPSPQECRDSLPPLAALQILTGHAGPSSWGRVTVLGMCPGPGSVLSSWGCALILGNCHGTGDVPSSWGRATVLGLGHRPGNVPSSWGCALVLGMCPSPGDVPLSCECSIVLGM